MVFAEHEGHDYVVGKICITSTEPFRGLPPV